MVKTIDGKEGDVTELGIISKVPPKFRKVIIDLSTLTDREILEKIAVRLNLNVEYELNAP